MKIVKNNITDKNINMIMNVINDSYNEFFIFKLINLFFYKKFLLNNEILILYDNNNIDIIEIIVYKINNFNNYDILVIHELCVINKYKSLGYSKILINSLFEKIKEKMSNVI